MTDPRPSAGDLEAKAKAATPGPWGVDEKSDEWFGVESDADPEDWVCHADESRIPRPKRNDAFYIAAANPATVLALLADWTFLKYALAAECSCTDEGTHPSQCDPCNVIGALRVRE